MTTPAAAAPVRRCACRSFDRWDCVAARYHPDRPCEDVDDPYPCSCACHEEGDDDDA